MQTFYADLAAKAADFLPNLLVALLILVGSLYLSRLLSGLLRKALNKKGTDLEITRLICQVTRWSILVVGIISALQRFFDVTAFLAGLGILCFYDRFCHAKHHAEFCGWGHPAFSAAFQGRRIDQC
jgi:small-conductance mechanosensitive channel